MARIPVAFGRALPTEGDAVDRHDPRTPRAEDLTAAGGPNTASVPKLPPGLLAKSAGGLAKGFGEAFGAVGDYALKEEKRRKEAQALLEKQELARAKAEYASGLIEIETELEGEQDSDQLVNDYESRVIRLRDRITGGLPSQLHNQFDTDTMVGGARSRARIDKKRRALWKTGKINQLDGQDDLTRNLMADADPETRREMIDAYVRSADALAALGVIDRDEATRRKREMGTFYAGAVVGEWFRNQDTLAAAKAMEAGQFDDAEVSAAWERLDPEQRDKLFDSLVDQRVKITRMENDAEEAREAEESAAVNERYQQVIFSDNQLLMRQSLDEFRRSPYINDAQLKELERRVNAGQTGIVDNESHVSLLLGQIQDREIKNRRELIEAARGLEVSTATLSGRLMKAVEDYDDEEFARALEWGTAKAKVLIVGNGGLYGNARQINRAADFAAQMREFRRNNPTGDYWAKAREIVQRQDETGNAEAAKNLPRDLAEYRASLRRGDARKIAEDKQFLIDTLIEAGYSEVSTLSLDPSFDPIAYAEEIGRRATQKRGAR